MMRCNQLGSFQLNSCSYLIQSLNLWGFYQSTSYFTVVPNSAPQYFSWQTTFFFLLLLHTPSLLGPASSSSVRSQGGCGPLFVQKQKVVHFSSPPSLFAWASPFSLCCLIFLVTNGESIKSPFIRPPSFFPCQNAFLEKCPWHVFFHKHIFD